MRKHVTLLLRKKPRRWPCVAPPRRIGTLCARDIVVVRTLAVEYMRNTLLSSKQMYICNPIIHRGKIIMLGHMIVTSL